MRITAMLMLALLSGCGQQIRQNQAQAVSNIITSSNELDNLTIASFKHIKPSDRDECLSRASAIPITLVNRRNGMLSSCLSAANNRNQGL